MLIDGGSGMIPKFRAYHKELKMMFEVKSLVYTLRLARLTNRNDLVPSRTCSFDDIILMQSTGMVDKNGVEIFEGDIVILFWSDEVGESHWGKVTIKNPFEYTPEEARYFIYSDGIEVIGNIYENPELLESV